LTLRDNEIEFLKSRNIDIDYENLDEFDYFLHYMYARIIEISEDGGDGTYGPEAVAKAKQLKSASVRPLKLVKRKLWSMLKDAGHNL
jgi:hypothetical protein